MPLLLSQLNKEMAPGARPERGVHRLRTHVLRTGPSTEA